MTRALVTGATGFIGPHLVRALLDQGFAVACLRRPTSHVGLLEPLGVNFVPGDVTRPETLPAAVGGAEVVFHLAGLTRALSHGEIWAANVEGTRNVLAACASMARAPVVVIVSSLAAAGPSLGGRPQAEDGAAAPVSNYGRSKRASERVAHEFAGRVPTTIVRPPLVFGEGDRSVLAIFRPIRRFGLHLVPGFAERRFSAIHVADLSAAIIAAALRGQRIQEKATKTNAGYYYVAADEHPTYAELGCRIALALDRGSLVLRTPEWLTWAAAGVSEVIARVRGRPHAFNWDKAREAVAGSWTCSPMRAQRELGWNCAADLDQRLRETVTWYREHGWL
jgi:dihydroflavonol-4-reductase